jgi:putative hydrolase of the HAD superfamily
MIKAVIFDFGNVICHFDNHRFTSELAVFSPLTENDLYQKIYTQSNLPRLYETGTISSDIFYEKLIELCRLEVSKDAFIHAYTRIFTPITSTFRLIKQLHKTYKIALLSNTNELHFNYVIKQQGIFIFFDVVSLSFKVKAMKPDRRIFDDCLKKLGLLPEECVYIDDIKEYADKATELGLTGIHYKSEENLKLILTTKFKRSSI